MMYIVGANYLLLVVVVAELEMEYSVQIMLNYLNNIVNYKFGKQCIHCKYRKQCNENGNAENIHQQKKQLCKAYHLQQIHKL